MSAPWNPPMKAEDFQFPWALEDAGNPGSLKANPTIAAGDFKVSKDGGAFANLTNLPTVSPAGGTQILILLTATEMNADNVFVQMIDQTSPKEWADSFYAINTVQAV